MRILRAIVGLLIALLLTGAVYQRHQAGADREAYPAPGRFVEVDGLALHLDCRGSGEPLLVLEAGLTSGSASWMLVHDALARITTVCAYDRPGIDWSDPTGRIADAGEVASRLHRLLERAGVSGPYVFLGMSAGGVYVREYQRRWPEGIVGMVLVDSSHEQQGDRLPEIDGGGTFRRVLALCSWLQPLGVVRAFSLIDPLIEQFDIPAQVAPVMRANLYQSHACGAILDEMRSFEAEVRDSEPPSGLGDLPLLVLSQGKEPEANESFGLSEELAREQRVVWDELQDELAALSSRGRRIVASESGHVIQFDQPQLLIDSVTELVLTLRESP